jgi:TPR repeat protein
VRGVDLVLLNKRMPRATGTSRRQRQSATGRPRATSTTRQEIDVTSQHIAALRHIFDRVRPSNRWRALRVAAIVIAAVGAAPVIAGGPAADGHADAARQAADGAFDAGRYTEALASYEALARHGDALAARRAGELLLYGQGLLPAVPPCAVARAVGWLALAAAGGDDDARGLWAQAAGLPRADVGDSAGTWLGRR